MQPENTTSNLGNIQGAGMPTTAPSADTATPKKALNPLLFVVIIMAVLIVALGAGLVVMMGQNNTANERIEKLEKELEEAKKNDSSTADAELKRIEEQQRSARNVERMNAVSHLLTAMTTYQSNNNGKTPFSDGTVNDKFIQRYVDADCVTADGLSYRNCSVDFKDPSGEIYGFAAPIVVEEDIDEALTDLDKMDYKFHVFINAECGNDNAIVLGRGVRQVAIMMKLEGGSVTCDDNH